MRDRKMIDNWEASPAKALLDAIHDADRCAATVEYRVLDIADRLAGVGMDRLADECAASVAGLVEAIKRIRDAHSDSQNYDLRESERGIAHMLSAIIGGSRRSVCPIPSLGTLVERIGG
jgi:hypothetical protein